MNNKFSIITNLFEGKEIRSIWDFEIKPAAIPLTLDDGLRLSFIYKKR